MDDYKNIKELLKPRRDFAASDTLRSRVNRTIGEHNRKRIALRTVLSIAAGWAAIIICAAIYIFSHPGSDAPITDQQPFVAAYINGRRLPDDQAAESTLRAMERADSLMNSAARIEQENLLRAEKILNNTILN